MYLSLLAPGMASLGVAYSFRGQGTLEIELTCPVTPYQIVLGRMLVIFGYNTIVGLTGSAVLVGSNSGLIFSALVMDWLAPMLLWGAMLFYRFNLYGFAYSQWVKSLVTPEVMTLSGLGLILAGFYSSRYIWNRTSGVNGMRRVAAAELGAYGIRVNTVHPGVIATPMSEQGDVEDFIKELEKTIPLKRTGKTEEVSNMAIFLASDDSSYSSGSEFVIDGGMISDL